MGEISQRQFRVNVKFFIINFLLPQPRNNPDYSASFVCFQMLRLPVANVTDALIQTIMSIIS